MVRVKLPVVLLLLAPLPLPSAARAQQDKALQVRADTATLLKWETTLGEGSSLTALDAARRVFPGAELNESGEFVLKSEKVLRMPGTSKERSVLPAGTKIEPRTRLTVRSQGKRYAVLLWEGTRPEGSPDSGGFAGQVSVVGVFPPGAAEPTDVAELKTDQFTFFGEEEFLPLGSDDGFTVVNHHASAGQPYDAVSLYHLPEGRLRRIADIFTLSQMDGCAKAFREDLTWQTRPGGQGDYPDVVVAVDLVHAPADFQEGCDHKGKETHQTFQALYRWNGAQARYVRAGGNIEKLDRWNENHM